MESEGSAATATARAGAGAAARVRAAAPPRSAASSTAVAEGAAKFLVGLPSRGNFSSTIPSSNLGGIRVYVCEHDTDPPEGQIVKTDTTNILIRSLQISKQKSEANDAKAAERGKGKRSGARNSDGRSPAKRANTGAAVASSRQGGFSEQTLQSMTVERLRALLKEKGLSTRGKKARTLFNTVI
ncbi:hypothetical protein ACMD2_17695 [Ananas comosus]|uniref:SAP domain-containing protein n=1 Tax=Ananas comosus TaxID=4615 RepID=A0A199UJC1_ANACO|nr:hypothetical protein ACMD2_17695 [Ananas comosus]